jgi:hypothetical protein
MATGGCVVAFESAIHNLSDRSVHRGVIHTRAMPVFHVPGCTTSVKAVFFGATHVSSLSLSLSLSRCVFAFEVTSVLDCDS